LTFLFLGLDGLDFDLVQEYDFGEKVDGTPVSFSRLDQNLPEAMSQQGNDRNNTGHWTFYVWGAMASGQLQTPEFRQEHPLPGEVEWPLNKKYVQRFPSSFTRYLKGRLKGRERYKSFAWDEFDSVKVVNFPVCIPEYCENCEIMRRDAISRDYENLEFQVLQKEINHAIENDYDAVFAVTRRVDCICHGATSPGNFGAEDEDKMFRGLADVSFEEVHESGTAWTEFVENDMQKNNSEEQRRRAEEIKDAVLAHVEQSYDEAAALVNGINWEGVSEHVVVSDHGFGKLGAGSVNAHSRNAVLSCSFGRYRRMSQFIENWRSDLPGDLETGEAHEQTEEEKVKEQLEALGYT
jgi:hypothetical protein